MKKRFRPARIGGWVAAFGLLAAPAFAQRDYQQNRYVQSGFSQPYVYNGFQRNYVSNANYEPLTSRFYRDRTTYNNVYIPYGAANQYVPSARWSTGPYRQLASHSLSGTYFTPVSTYPTASFRAGAGYGYPGAGFWDGGGFGYAPYSYRYLGSRYAYGPDGGYGYRGYGGVYGFPYDYGYGPYYLFEPPGDVALYQGILTGGDLRDFRAGYVSYGDTFRLDADQRERYRLAAEGYFGQPTFLPDDIESRMHHPARFQLDERPNVTTFGFNRDAIRIERPMQELFQPLGANVSYRWNPETRGDDEYLRIWKIQNGLLAPPTGMDQEFYLRVAAVADEVRGAGTMELAGARVGRVGTAIIPTGARAGYGTGTAPAGADGEPTGTQLAACLNNARRNLGLTLTSMPCEPAPEPIEPVEEPITK